MGQKTCYMRFTHNHFRDVLLESYVLPPESNISVLNLTKLCKKFTQKQIKSVQSCNSNNITKAHKS